VPPPALRIDIDPTSCMGSGNCVFWAPGVFELGDDGIAVVVDPDATAEDRILAAATGCPTRSITVTRAGERIEP
jgi:ferredoxin